MEKNANQEYICQEETAAGMKTFWSDCPHFKKIPEDEIIILEPYLHASEEVTKLFDLFGAVFGPVKNDMLGNIKKLKRRRDTNPEKLISINSILEDEKGTDSIDGQTGALWLTRALLYVQQMLVHLIDSVRKRPEEYKFRPILLKAYDETLKPFHGWFASKLFSTMAYAAPNIPELIKSLTYNNEADGIKEKLLEDMELYLENLTKTNEVVIKVLKSLELYSEARA